MTKESAPLFGTNGRVSRQNKDLRRKHATAHPENKKPRDAWTPEEYSVYFRCLETDDDYIRYYRRRHAFWRLYGLDLPDGVLRKLYYGNALRLFPQIDRSLFPEFERSGGPALGLLRWRNGPRGRGAAGQRTADRSRRWARMWANPDHEEHDGWDFGP